MAQKFSLWGLLMKEQTALTANQLSLISYYKWLKLLCMGMFEWKGLPETINVEYLEETLFTKGRLIFFKDPVLGFLALSCIPDGHLNVYNEPVSFSVNVPAYQSKEPLTRFNSVLIKNNQLSESSMYTIGEFAGRLAETERTIDINVRAQKTPIVVAVTSDKALLTLRNAYKQFEEGQPVLFVDSNQISMDTLKAIKTDAPYLVDKLDTHKMNLWNEALSFLGINNANTNKRERLISNEVDANEELIQMSANIMLKTRQDAVKLINKMFGLNVSVEIKSFEEPFPDETQTDDVGGDESE